MTAKLKIFILGGGTAGWMTANLLAKAWEKQGVSITLMEAPDVPTVGVGEGSTPYIRRFFERMNISESEWMPKCHATYKTGIRFTDWSTTPGFQHYFHPFTTELDNVTFNLFKHHVSLRRQGLNIHVHPDDYFLMTRLANNFQLPSSNDFVKQQTFYAYHFDAKLLGDYLKNKALEQGVSHVEGKVLGVEKHPNGDIAAVHDQSLQRFDADIFIDCSGFKSLLMQKALKVPFISYGDTLLNDAAVAIPTAAEKPYCPQTLSAAMPCGWRWKIPLTQRTGNGYVYSSSHLSAEDAEKQLRHSLGADSETNAAHHLKMKVGRNTKHWYRNCLAVGLSQGFIEPLEATGLQMTLVTIEQFITHFEKGKYTNEYQDNVNNGINAAFDHIRDYVSLHYLANSRNDTRYWQDCRNDIAISDSLKRVLEVWSQGGDLEQELNQQNISQYYPSLSWFAILTGMGIYPKTCTVDKKEIERFHQARANMASFFNNYITPSGKGNSAQQHGVVRYA